jgi:hypothetical protein
MPARTRRDPHFTEEAWMIMYGDVRVGSIKKTIGNASADP